MKKTIISLVAAVFMGSVYAQTSQFEGFSVGLGISVVGANTKTNINTLSIDLGKTSTVPSIDLAYTKSFGSNFLLGVGLAYDFSKIKSGEISDGIRIGIETEDHYSIYLQPQYLVNNSTVLFGKLGYHSIKGKITGDFSSYFTPEKTHGIGYGIGIKSNLNNNSFIQAEAQITDYSEKSFDYGGGINANYNPKSSSAVITLGHRF